MNRLQKLIPFFIFITIVCPIFLFKTSSRALAMPWYFADIGDTQSADQGMNANLFNHIKSNQPKMLLHTGDTELEAAGKMYYVYMHDFQISTWPSEIHIAFGNHDDIANYFIYPEVLHDVCYGQKDLTAITPGYSPFNPEVNNVPLYCDTNDAVHKYYSFIRGGIKFIVLGNRTGKEAQYQFAIDQICNHSDGTSASIVIHSEGNDFTQIKSIINSLNGCPNNFKLAFVGDGHRYDHQTYNGVELFETAGWFYGRGTENITQDYFYAQVNSNSINIYRVPWLMTNPDFDPPVFVATIPGTFTDYYYGGVNPGVVFQFKADGVSRSRPNQLFNINMVSTTGMQMTRNGILFNVDANGIFSNVNDPFNNNNLVPGIYNIYAIGPRHLTKLFPNVQVAANLNTLNLTNTYLLAGDIVKDNTVNDLDYNRMIEDFGPRMPTTGSPADVDLDGDVDIYDYSLMTKNYGLSGDSVP